MSKIFACDLLEKQCKLCEKVYSVENFYKQKAYKNEKTYDTWDCYCKSCRLKYSSDRKRSLKLEAMVYMGGKCVDCGECREIPSIYDFHHLDSSHKDFTIGKHALKLETIKKELDKCVMLCAVCHRIRHIEP